MKRIGVLGGMFSPFHNGHAAMIDQAREACSLDEIWIMPSKKPPHKLSGVDISALDRVNMLELYAAGFEDVFVCKKELEMDGITYTAETFNSLRKDYPDYKFYFIIGADSLLNFHRWYKPGKIIKNADLLVCKRSGSGLHDIEKEIDRLRNKYGGEIKLLSSGDSNRPSYEEVSSSEIRWRISHGYDISMSVPGPVNDYIREHKLYMEDRVMPTVKEIKKKMEELLPSKRFSHVLGVKDTAAELAEIYGVDKTRAKIAGLLHDCAKTLSADELINLCEQHDVPYTAEEVADESTTKSLLHSKAGSILAKHEYNIDDEEILSSIFYHTVGKPDMTMLEKIIYTADYIEPGRSQKTKPELDKIRKTARENIDLAVYYIAKNTVDYLVEEKKPMDEKSVATLEYYRQICNIQE